MVALLAMATVVDSGAGRPCWPPTEVLAAQHYASISAILGDLGRPAR